MSGSKLSQSRWIMNSSASYIWIGLSKKASNLLMNNTTLLFSVFRNRIDVWKRLTYEEIISYQPKDLEKNCRTLLRNAYWISPYVKLNFGLNGKCNTFIQSPCFLDSCVKVSRFKCFTSIFQTNKRDRFAQTYLQL